MLKLPLNIPDGIAGKLSPLLEGVGVADLMPQLAQAVREMFGAEMSLMHFQYVGQVSKISAICRPEICWELADSDSWFSSSVHDLVVRDLRARLCPISYSEFSWPYSRAQIVGPDSEPSLTLPAPYVLLLPISSDLVVYDQRHRKFFGYLALFFSEFPQADERFIQLVMCLPGLLSEIAAVRVSAEENSASQLSAALNRLQLAVLKQKELHLPLSPGELLDQQSFGELERGLFAIISETNLMLLVTDQLSAVAGPNRQEVDFNQLVEQTAELARPFYEQAQVQLRLELDSTLPLQQLDCILLSSVVYNLLDNALKFSQPGGEVTVCTLISDAGGVRLEVKDFGRPVDFAERELIFDKLVRGSNSNGVTGNGWGLYIAQSIVHSHRGKITLENLEEVELGGKKFVVELPAVQSPV